METEPSLSNTQSYLQSVSPLQVKLNDNFWHPRLQKLSSRTIKDQFNLLAQTGRLENFLHAAGKSSSPFQGYFFNDSDVYKWLEAAVWVQAQNDHPDDGLTKAIEETIDLIAASQEPDGYLDTYFVGEKAGQRWSNLKDMHEMYCAGHLIQAAVADHRARNETRLMAIARRLAEHINSIFGPAKRAGVPGHPEIELALVDLYRETNFKPYLDLAKYFIDERGKGIIGGSSYHQDHKPIREMDQLAGHAVRAMYLCAGAADVYEFNSDNSLLNALSKLWDKMTASQIYVNGGVGARHEGEAFGEAFELPNSRAYAETCAAIGSVMWNQRMFRLTRNSRYADLLEWTLFNAVLPGISLEGDAYFYENPLSDQGNSRRSKWFPCACCPPNIARLLATYPGYLYAVGQSNRLSEIFLYGYAQNTANISMPDGKLISFSQTTDYPWQGQVEILVLNCQYDAPVRLHLRIPGWTEGLTTHLYLNDHLLASPAPGSFATITQEFKTGDRIQLEFPLQPRWLSSHPFLAETTQRCTLTRGPLVYCLESADNPGVDLRLVETIPDMAIREQPDLLDGIMGLKFQALEFPLQKEWQGKLYLPTLPDTNTPRDFEAVAVPYYAWANRQTGQMQVWINDGRNSQQKTRH